MTSLAVDKIKQKVSLALSDQSQFSGHIFLSRVSELGVGQQTIMGALTGPERFVPFETTQGEFTFLNQDHIVWVASMLEKDLMKAVVAEERRNVTVLLQGGKRLKGDLVMAVPEEKTRLSDLLNEVGDYMTLQDDKREILINVNYVVRVF